MPPIKNDEYALVSNPVFRRIFIFIRFLGSIIALASLITEVAYLTTHRFSSLTYWICYLVTCLLRVNISLLVWACNMKKKVIGKKPKSFLYNIDENKRQEMTKTFQK